MSWDEINCDSLRYFARLTERSVAVDIQPRAEVGHHIIKMDCKLVIFLFYVFVVGMSATNSQAQSTTKSSKATCGSSGIPGVPGVPGHNGLPGPVGAKGEPGANSKPGTKGKPGDKGEPGIKGDPGVKGDPGKYGMPGPAGPAGTKGEPGERGNPGRDGKPGAPAPAGANVEPVGRGTDNVDFWKSNWKQCVWKREDSKDTGLIQNCIFKKKYDNTSLRVFYEGAIRSYGSPSCSRWYFTFDGVECTKPATIEGVVYVSSTQTNPHRHRHIEGFCNQIPKGNIRVGFWIGKCVGRSLGDGYTGWESLSRIVIEEVPPPQT